MGRRARKREREGICRGDKSITYIDKVEDGGVSRGSVLERMGASAHVDSLVSCREWGRRGRGIFRREERLFYLHRK